MPYADPTSEAARASQRRASRKHYEANRSEEIKRARDWAVRNKKRVNALAVQRRSKRMPPEKVLWWNARNRAKAKGLEFTLRVEDIQVPATCPVLGIPLVIATRAAQPGSPSLDRLDPTRGYTADNVRVISHKANTIKSNGSIEDLRLVLAYMETTLARK